MATDCHVRVLFQIGARVKNVEFQGRKSNGALHFSALNTDYSFVNLRRAYEWQESFTFPRWSRLPKHLSSLARSRSTQRVESIMA